MSSITNAGPPIAALWAWIVVDENGQEAVCRSPWSESGALMGPDRESLDTFGMRQWCEMYYEGRTVKLVRFDQGLARWEVRVRCGEGGPMLTTCPPDEDQAREEYARELVDGDRISRVELVKVVEVLEASQGPGERIDPWHAIMAPFLRPEDRR